MLLQFYKFVSYNIITVCRKFYKKYGIDMFADGRFYDIW